MNRLVGEFKVSSPNYEDRFIFIDKGGNHCTIYNNSNTLFDGYILQGYKVWEEKVQQQKQLAEHFKDLGFSFELVV